MSNVRKGTLSNFIDGIKLEEADDTLKGRAVIQRDPKYG